ncbi:MAG: hypothetical protein ACTSRC_21035, partial [Candidatus Helarchaeota archaeon]
MELSCEKLKENLIKFPEKYQKDFDAFWVWKNEKESGGQYVLDDVLIEATYVKLAKILNGWQTYRQPKNKDPFTTLRESLVNIKAYYDKIKEYDLTRFNEIPRGDLEEIWHELGRVKEYGGCRNSRGRYNVIAVCKPLMLLWGQTLAFDSNVRYNISGMDIRMGQYQWTFEKWYDAMITFSD